MILFISAPAKEGSNIIERIAASRKERHEAAVEEMQQELSVISSVGTVQSLCNTPHYSMDMDIT